MHLNVCFKFENACNFVSYFTRWWFDAIYRVVHSSHFNLETAVFLHFCILLDIGFGGVPQNPNFLEWHSFLEDTLTLLFLFLSIKWWNVFLVWVPLLSFVAAELLFPTKLTNREQRHGHLLKCHGSIVCIVIQCDAAGHENSDERTLLCPGMSLRCCMFKFTVHLLKVLRGYEHRLCEWALTFQRHVQHQCGHTDSAQIQSFAFGFLREGAGQVSGVMVLVQKSIVCSPSLNQHSAPRSAHLETVMRCCTTATPAAAASIRTQHKPGATSAREGHT